jgi:ABC-type Na+ transport system ATPase subunit NatA
MHQGRILAEGTQQELREKYGEQDLEDLFFELLGQNQPTVTLS